ncbi:MAG: hypothetical protein MZV64_15285 [Ignavibacteriales bacterium]|nr:hypothetical protein [Ignavibacteriales bacterium]
MAAASGSAVGSAAADSAARYRHLFHGRRLVALARAHLDARPLHAHLDGPVAAIGFRVGRGVAEEVSASDRSETTRCSPALMSLESITAMPSVLSAAVFSVSWR